MDVPHHAALEEAYERGDLAKQEAFARLADDIFEDGRVTEEERGPAFLLGAKASSYRSASVVSPSGDARPIVASQTFDEASPFRRLLQARLASVSAEDCGPLGPWLFDSTHGEHELTSALDQDLKDALRALAETRGDDARFSDEDAAEFAKLLDSRGTHVGEKTRSYLSSWLVSGRCQTANGWARISSAIAGLPEETRKNLVAPATVEAAIRGLAARSLTPSAEIARLCTLDALVSLASSPRNEERFLTAFEEILPSLTLAEAEDWEKLGQIVRRLRDRVQTIRPDPDWPMRVFERALHALSEQLTQHDVKKLLALGTTEGYPSKALHRALFEVLATRAFSDPACRAEFADGLGAIPARNAKPCTLFFYEGFTDRGYEMHDLATGLVAADPWLRVVALDRKGMWLIEPAVGRRPYLREVWVKDDSALAAAFRRDEWSKEVLTHALEFVAQEFPSRQVVFSSSSHGSYLGLSEEGHGSSLITPEEFGRCFSDSGVLPTFLAINACNVGGDFAFLAGLAGSGVRWLEAPSEPIEAGTWDYEGWLTALDKTFFEHGCLPSGSRSEIAAWTGRSGAHRAGLAPPRPPARMHVCDLDKVPDVEKAMDRLGTLLLARFEGDGAALDRMRRAAPIYDEGPSRDVGPHHTLRVSATALADLVNGALGENLAPDAFEAVRNACASVGNVAVLFALPPSPDDREVAWAKDHAPNWWRFVGLLKGW